MQGTLRKNATGRWEIVDDEGKRVELTSGDVCEVKVGENWIQTRIESSSDGYYAIVAGLQLFAGQAAKIAGY